MNMRCPLKFNAPPCQECPLGENTFKTNIQKWKKCSCEHKEMDVQKSLNCLNCNKPIVTCHWAIKSKEDNYCMWSYLSKKDNQKPITNRKVSQYVDYTEQRVGQIIKIANEKILNLYKEQLERMNSN